MIRRTTGIHSVESDKPNKRRILTKITCETSVFMKRVIMSTSRDSSEKNHDVEVVT